MRKLPNFGLIKGGVLKWLFKVQHENCCYCGKRMRYNHQGNDPLRASREHIQRVADGGRNVSGNYAAAHSWCNSFRGDKNWLLFKSVMMREFDEALIAFPHERNYIEKMKERYMKGDWVPQP